MVRGRFAKCCSVAGAVLGAFGWVTRDPWFTPLLARPLPLNDCHLCCLTSWNESFRRYRCSCTHLCICWALICKLTYNSIVAAPTPLLLLLTLHTFVRVNVFSCRDRYNRPLLSVPERMPFIQDFFLRTSLMRFCRIMPAFGAGGIVNTGVRASLRDD